MPIELSCPGCGRTLRVADDAAGKHARCPACGSVSRVPVPVGAPPEPGQPGAGDSSGYSGYASSRLEPLANPFADPAPSKPTPYGAEGVNPFADQGPVKETFNPYQAPASYGYVHPHQLQRRLASRGKRFLGAIVDSVFVMFGAAPGLVLLIAAADANEELAMVGMLLMFGGMLIVGIVNWAMITKNGQSIAKKLLGMQIIQLDTGRPAGFVNGVVLRSWIPFLINQACSFFGLIDALWIFGEERRCLHDLIAQTIVVDV